MCSYNAVSSVIIVIILTHKLPCGVFVQIDKRRTHHTTMLHDIPEDDLLLLIAVFLFRLVDKINLARIHRRLALLLRPVILEVRERPAVAAQHLQVRSAQGNDPPPHLMECLYPKPGIWSITDLSEVVRTSAVLTRLNLGRVHIGADVACIAKALEVNMVMKELYLDNNNIDSKGAIAIGEALKVNMVLTLLHLNRNMVGNDGAKAIFSALNVNTGLTTLSLTWNKISEVGVIEEVLKSNRVLKKLSLWNNKISSQGGLAIAEALKVNNVLTDLHLGTNQIGGVGVKAIGKALEVNQGITNLDLRYNNMGDDGAIGLVSALKVNCALKSLGLDENQISDTGAHAIAGALESNRVLTRLVLKDNIIQSEGAAAIADALKSNPVFCDLDLRNNMIYYPILCGRRFDGRIRYAWSS